MPASKIKVPTRKRYAARLAWAVAGLVTLSGCDAGEDMWSEVTGTSNANDFPDNSAEGGPPAAASTDAAAAAEAPASAQVGAVSSAPAPAPLPSAPPAAVNAPTGDVAALGPPAGGDSGTFVGIKVRDLRAELQRLSDMINQHSQDLQRTRGTLSGDANSYYSLIAGINSRLQVGTTPGNPQVIAQFNQAQGALDRMNDDLSGLSTLSSNVASDLAFAVYVLEDIKAAFSLQGAVEEDHRQLSAMQTATNGDIIVVQDLERQVADEMTRQNSYIANERRNLTTLALAIKNGELYGQSFSNATAAQVFGGARPAYASAEPTMTADRRPLVTIRFDRPNVSYEQALYTAISRALDRRPNAMFDLVAVSPNAGSGPQVTIRADEARRNAENVMRSLARMGLPADRIAVSSMTSGNIQTSEVDIFVR
jgi:hypothetical protein